MVLKSVKKVGKGKTRCITVSNPNGLYVTDNGIVTHNSTAVVNLMLHTATLFALMWAPYRYYGYAPSTQFTIVFGGYSQKKASELLLEPLIKALQCSDFFQRCRTWDDMVKKQKEFENTNGVPHVYWTTASPTSQPMDCKVYLPDGSYKRMGDIQIGDIIKSPTQCQTRVIGIPFEGETECYEITLEDGRTTKCGGWHKWMVSYRTDGEGKKIWEIVDTNFMIAHPEFDFEVVSEDDLKECFSYSYSI